MVNQWVQFVKEYARENNISYGRAISEAGPAYRNMKQGGDTRRKGKSSLRGKGFDDLPDDVHKEIGDNLDNNSIVNLPSTNKDINENKGIRKEQQRRIPIVKADLDNLIYQAEQLHSSWHTVMTSNNRDTFNQYYDRVIVALHRLTKLQNDKLLSEQQRLTARNAVEILNRDLNIMRGAINRADRQRRNNARDVAPITTPWYQGLFRW
jgi:hypothetical protein